LRAVIWKCAAPAAGRAPLTVNVAWSNQIQVPGQREILRRAQIPGGPVLVDRPWPGPAAGKLALEDHHVPGRDGGRTGEVSPGQNTARPEGA
jgi:hypothetical protein